MFRPSKRGPDRVGTPKRRGDPMWCGWDVRQLESMAAPMFHFYLVVWGS